MKAGQEWSQQRINTDAGQWTWWKDQQRQPERAIPDQRHTFVSSVVEARRGPLSGSSTLTATPGILGGQGHEQAF